MHRRWIPLSAVAAIALAAFLGLRRALGIDFDPDSIVQAVERMGPFGPLAFVGIVIFRVPLGLPSQLVLLGGGALFGAMSGTLYGAVGLVVSAMLCFAGARWAGRESVEARLPERLRGLLDVAGTRAGAAFIAVGTGYPFGPITSYHLLAGVTAMSALVFALSVSLGSVVRAGLYTTFGSALMQGDRSALLSSAACVAVALALPLCFSSSRAWLLQALGRPQSQQPEPGS